MKVGINIKKPKKRKIAIDQTTLIDFLIINRGEEQ